MCLEQGTRSLEEHLIDYLLLVPLTTFPDDILRSFLIAGLNSSTKAQLSGRGPRGSFQEFVEWVLASCGSALIVGPVDDDASPTHDPVHNQDHPDGEDLQLEPTAGHVSDSAATFEPASVGATEPNKAREPEHHESDQVCEPAATSTAEGVLVDIEGMEVSPIHPPATESDGSPVGAGSGADSLAEAGSGADSMAWTPPTSISTEGAAILPVGTGKAAILSIASRALECVATGKLECVATGEFECVATAEFECVATSDLECVATDELECVATAVLESVATGVLESVATGVLESIATGVLKSVAPYELENEAAGGGLGMPAAHAVRRDVILDVQQGLDLALDDQRRRDEALGDQRRHDVDLGDQRRQDVALGDQRRQDVALGDQQRRDLALGDQ
ncbi:hypothetical protein DPX16_9262 [Anabarilius grahami]|uniref:Uncharacterized protein n=1 Tax=Anabarilius grahami TaxID=495550 RepID=A0A3N0Y6C4_ANAGA|nr:hypothetical protein DPX16_9262 [Anabarilius grahami]